MAAFSQQLTSAIPPEFFIGKVASWTTPQPNTSLILALSLDLTLARRHRGTLPPSRLIQRIRGERNGTSA